ncbi:MAG: hypothetical protein U1G08_11840 [Verrucomicrobiota bacterium]
MEFPVPLRHPVVLGLMFGVAAIAASVRAEPHAFIQDRLAIGMWVPPQTDVDLESRYREIADAHFTVVIGTAGTNAIGQLALCERHGLRAIVSGSGPVDTLPDGPACWGYLLTDEPNAAAFPGLATIVATLREKRPGRLGYVNLFPNYASTGQLGTPTYPAYVAAFVETVRPDVLSMDHYPVMSPNADRRDAYCDNLEVLRLESLRAGIPFWNYFHSMPFADRIDPTEAQIRWQIFTSLAYGARGILYFCYWTPGKGNAGTGEFPKGGALLTAEGRKTRHYDEARRINAELLHLGPTLMQLTNTGVRRLNTATNAANSIPGFPIRSLARVGTDPESTFIAGAFTHSDGRRAVLLVNHDIAYTAWPTVQFEAPPGSVLEISKDSGHAAPVVDDSPELPGLQLSFGPGDGRLFVLPRQP